jgi:hypothetical protein
MPAKEQILELQENEMLIVFAALVFMSMMMEKELGGSSCCISCKKKDQPTSDPYDKLCAPQYYLM